MQSSGSLELQMSDQYLVDDKQVLSRIVQQNPTVPRTLFQGSSSNAANLT
jgi:hypothetical protein